MKPTTRERHHRGERKRARRRRRVATGRRPRRYVVDKDAADRNWARVMNPIREQSYKRQKKLDQEARKRRESRKKGWLAR